MKSSEPLHGFSGERRHTLKTPPALPPLLEEALCAGRLSHALCLEEESAARRMETALALAGAILCQKKQGHMCGECAACRKVLMGAHADLTICDPAENKDAYKKENLRTLRAEAYRRPVEGNAKVVLLQSAELISAEGQNLLLKIIEEPPEDTVFILTCANRYRLLGTVLSRVTVYPLPPLPETESMQRLQELAPGHTGEEYGRALVRCGGSPEAGALLLRDAATQKRYAAAEEMLAGLSTGNGYRVMAAAAPLERDRAQYAALLETLASLLANPLLREIYNLPDRTAARFRGELMPLFALCERNAYLPLVTAVLVKRCKR